MFPSFDVRGSDDGGESTPNLGGKEAAIGPYLAAIDMPLLSKELGRGASNTDKPFEGGDLPNCLS